VFPIDVHLEKHIKQSDVRLRPEYVKNYKEDTGELIKISAGALSYQSEDEEGMREDLILARASQILKYNHLPSFVRNLDNLNLMPMSSEELMLIMKQNGINMRYIAAIYKLTNLPYIREMMMVEAVVREIKKIYRECQKDFVM
jgi:hypothetical protein